MSNFEFNLTYKAKSFENIEGYIIDQVGDLKAQFGELDWISMGIDSPDNKSHQIHAGGRVYGLPITYSYVGESLAGGLGEVFDNLQFQLSECRKFFR